MQTSKYVEWWVNTLVAVILAGFVWGMDMGWVPWTGDQFGSFSSFVGMLIPFLAVSLLGAWLIRSVRRTSG